MKIPLVDLSWQHQEIREEVTEGLERVMSATSFIQGPEVVAFEDEFASFSGVSHCVGVGSGTDALELAVRALGIGPRDKVIVPANSFIASALGVLRAGAGVVLVDCDPTTYLLDVDHALDAIDSTVRAIMPVHLYGQMAPVELMGEVPSSIAIIEDAAQSQGATRFGRGCGSYGRVAATSFYPGKNIGAYGDGGAVLTNDSSLADEIRVLRNWGSDEKYHHPVLGFNSRLDTIQAVVLSAKLARLKGWNELRIKAADYYNVLLGDVEGVTTPAVLEGNTHVWHLYVVRVSDRDRIMHQMQRAGIGVGVHYPIPMHLQGALAGLGYGPGSFPATELAASEVLSLPMYPGISESEQDFVVGELTKALSNR